MVVAIGSDHGGFELKEVIKGLLTAEEIEFVDLGPENEESVDYPIYGEKVAKAVAAGEADRGIVICGTGIGISIAANKVPGIRCALCTNEFMAEMTRRHNDSNVLALGGRVLGTELAKSIVKMWLYTEFEGGRHQRRIDLITEIEEQNK